MSIFKAGNAASVVRLESEADTVFCSSIKIILERAMSGRECIYGHVPFSMTLTSTCCKLLTYQRLLQHATRISPLKSNQKHCRHYNCWLGKVHTHTLPMLTWCDHLTWQLENNKATLLEAGALGVLVDALKCTDPAMKEVTQRYVAVAICDLIQGSGNAVHTPSCKHADISHYVWLTRHQQVLHTGTGCFGSYQAHPDFRRHPQQWTEILDTDDLVPNLA